MKARNRVFTIIIALMTAFALGTCSLAESDEAMGLKDLRLGTSEYVITVPESFETGALTEEDVLEGDRKSTRLNSSHPTTSRMPSSA